MRLVPSKHLPSPRYGQQGAGCASDSPLRHHLKVSRKEVKCCAHFRTGQLLPSLSLALRFGSPFYDTEYGYPVVQISASNRWPTAPRRPWEVMSAYYYIRRINRIALGNCRTYKSIQFRHEYERDGKVKGVCRRLKPGPIYKPCRCRGKGRSTVTPSAGSSR